MTCFIVLVATLISIASATDSDPCIVSSQTAKKGQFPYQISVRMDGSHTCGGSILNERWVLTAAQCVHKQNTCAMTVVAGTNKLDGGGIIYQVKRSIKHKDFDMHQMVNDIALLEIDGVIKMNAKKQPIELNTEEICADADLVLSGWGRTSFPGNVPNDLQFIQLKSITSKDCNERHSSTGLSVDESQICTFTQRGQGYFHGDPGGPLAYNETLVGIVSWGRPCAVGYPDVFTRVCAFAVWITKNMC